MSEKTIRVCDGCGKAFEKTSEIYRLDLKTDSFWDGVETTILTKKLDFCSYCAKDVKEVLIKIAERLKDKK